VTIKMKPYFTEPGFKLYLADSLELLDKLEGESVDMIFVDPPYNLSNGGFTCHSGKRAPVKKGDWDISKGIELDYAFHKEWISKCRRVLKNNGTIWISGTYHSIYACGYALQSLDYHILNDICWFKPNAPPNLSTRFFAASHETLIWARKNEKAKHKFNYKLMKNEDWPKDPIKRVGKQMRSVWGISAPLSSEKKYGKHPTQKPMELLKRVVLSSTDKGDLILDPFAGSSTTGLVAYAYDRKFIGIDNNQGYLDLSIRRFNDLKIDLKRKKAIERSKRIEDYR
jgi:site-specific DNA-methyltransferase (adenine-specific)